MAGGEKGGGPLRRVYFGRELIHHHLRLQQQQQQRQEDEELEQKHEKQQPLSSRAPSSSTSPTSSSLSSSLSSSSSHASRETAFNSRVVSEYSVKQRRFIGPTSMDAEMSFIMANAAGVKEGSAVRIGFCYFLSHHLFLFALFLSLLLSFSETLSPFL